MAETVGQHSVAAFTSPVNGTTPIDANTVRGNDNTVRSAYVDHDADPGIHVQSSSLASRPVAGTVGRKWITVSSGRYQLWYDDGSRWHEVASDAVNVDCLADANLTKGDVVKITGFNNGQNLPTVNKVSASTDTAFGIVENTVTSGNIVQIVNTGLIEDVDTNGYAVGTILYPNSSGGFTTTKPTSGSYQPAGYVLRGNTNNGVLYVEFSAPRIVERSDNTASTVVLRDASGNFSAGTITAGALTSTGLVTFASLKGTGATTVTNILDEDNMASDSATALATQQSIKAYVDSKVATVDTLAEVLANGNTTGANDIIVNAGQKIRTPLIASQNNATAITIADTTGALTLASALADSNLATISTAGKVANSATTATSANTASAIVARDSSGNFSAGTITAALTGNASTATTLQTARNINGVSFNGSADITVTAAAGTLTGNTLASGVTASSLTSVGTLTSLTVSGSVSVSGANGYNVQVSGGNAYRMYATTNDLVFRSVTAGVDAMTITYGGGVTMSGDLTVDTSTLKVDSTNNRVGVGTASPSLPLDVRFSSNTTYSGASDSGNTLNLINTSTTDGTYSSIRFGLTGSTTASSVTLYGIHEGSGSAGFAIASRTSGTFSEKLRLDASGNLGLGVTPSAWASYFATLQIGAGGGFVAAPRTALDDQIFVGANAYTDGAWKRFHAGYATLYQQQFGRHEWSTAGTSTANSAITWTQAMTLDASGNLSVGGTAGGNRLRVTSADNLGTTTIAKFESNNGNQATLVRFASIFGENGDFTTGTSTNHNYILSSNNTERARITSGGNFGVNSLATNAKLEVNATSGEVFRADAGAALRIVANQDEVVLGGNIALGVSTSFGGGSRVVAIREAQTVPTTNPVGNGILYVEGGALKYRGTSGTVTTIANA